MRFLWIGLFGVTGVFARYFMGLAVGRAIPNPFPYPTFFINIAGAFVIGVVYAFGVERAAIPADLRVGLMVGLLGGFTTFSSYCLELSRLLEESEYLYAALYFCLSNALGLAATILGLAVTRYLVKGAP